jgi:hypothetical protein
MAKRGRLASEELPKRFVLRKKSHHPQRSQRRRWIRLQLCEFGVLQRHKSAIAPGSAFRLVRTPALESGRLCRRVLQLWPARKQSLSRNSIQWPMISTRQFLAGLHERREATGVFSRCGEIRPSNGGSLNFLFAHNPGIVNGARVPGLAGNASPLHKLETADCRL